MRIQVQSKRRRGDNSQAESHRRPTTPRSFLATFSTPRWSNSTMRAFTSWTISSRSRCPSSTSTSTCRTCVKRASASTRATSGRSNAARSPRSARRAPWSYDPDRKCVAHPEGCDECNAYLNHLDSHQAAQVSALKHAREIMVSSLAKDEQHAGYQKGATGRREGARGRGRHPLQPHPSFRFRPGCRLR